MLARVSLFFRKLAEPEITREARFEGFDLWKRQSQSNMKLLDKELEALYSARDALMRSASGENKP